MKNNTLTCFLLSILYFSSFSQEYQIPAAKQGQHTGIKRTLTHPVKYKAILPSEITKEGFYIPTIHNKSKVSKILDLLEEKLSRGKLLKKFNENPIGIDSPNENEKSTSLPPTILNGWSSETMGANPPDHTIAISNSGNVLIADNSRISFYTSTGILQGQYYYNAFFGINEMFTDPHVLYDSGADRFIFVIQSGVASAKEKLKVCFSKSNNPIMDGFHTYTYNITSIGKIDYPNIGVSTDELFIAADIDQDDNILLQLDKYQGYSGNNPTYNITTGISDGGIGGIWKARHLFPLTWGQQGNYGPGIFLIATEAAVNNDKVYLYQVTANQYNNPSVVLLSSISVPTFSPSLPALQLGTSCTLDQNTSWSNVSGGFYMDGIIHFCYSRDNGNNFQEAVYNRIDLSTYNITSQTIWMTSSDYRFASLASIGTSITDHSVVVGLLRSDNSIYPEMRYKYYDNSMNTFSSSLVKSGEDYVCISNPSRWGDYTTMQRKYNTSTYPTVWFSGGYGNTSHEWSTWISEIGYSNNTSITEQNNNSIEIYPNPNKGKFFIIQNNNIQNISISIINNLGKIILRAVSIEAKFEIDLSDQPSGYYFIQITSDTDRFSKKIILEK